MIPILFEKDETAFTRLGIGALTDCVTVTVKRVLNGQDELALTYPDNGIRVQELQNSRIIFAQPEYKKPSQPYVIYQVSKPVRGLITVYARHIRERASFIPVMPFTASSLADTLMKIDDYCAETSPFSYWTDKTVTANFKLEKPASLGNVLGGMEGSILDTYGGEYEFDVFLVKIWNRRGVDRGVTLRYGKNVTDATQEESIDSTITGICPFWTDGEGTLVTLPEKVVHSQNAANFPFNRTIPKDFSDQFENAPTEAQLRTAAQSYISQAGIGVPKVSLSVSFEHLAQYQEYQDVAVLETVNLGDTVTVIFERLDVNATARVVQTEYDVLNEKYRRVSIGGVKSNLGTTINGVVQEAKTEVRDTRTSLQRSIDRATDMLTGANGGYLVDIFDANGQRTGDMIMDTNDPATATNVWLRNLAGWGYSSTGVNGQYRTAITQDGHIVADFIDTGTLTANVIKAGILRSSSSSPNWWNLNTGELKAGYGTIGGWTIGASGLSKDTDLDGVTYQTGMWSPTSPTSGTVAFYVGYQENGSWVYPFSVNYAGKLKASGVEISGTITSYSGKIGGWTIGSNVIKKEPTIDGKSYNVGIYAPESPIATNAAFYVQNVTDNYYPFLVRYNGSLRAVGGGTIGAWTLKAGEASSSTPSQGSLYSGMSTLNSSSMGVYIGYDGVALGGGKFKVTRDGDLTATSGTFTGSITGSTITSSVDKTSNASSYSQSDVTTIGNLVLAGNYPTAAQLAKYDFNADGLVDVVDLAIINGLLTDKQTYTSRTTVTISPTDATSPIVISSGGAYDGGTITTKQRSAISVNHMESGAFLIHDNTSVRASIKWNELSWYDSSRNRTAYYTPDSVNLSKSSLNKYYLDIKGDSNVVRARYGYDGITFKNTSGTNTGTYSAFRASGAVDSWLVPANSTASRTISFGKTFPSAPYVWVQLTQSGDNTIYGNVNLAVTATTTTGFTVRAFNASGSAAGVPFRWMTF